VAVRRAHRSEAGRLAATLARAFDDDPLMTWMFPEPHARRRRLPKLFGALLGPAFARGDVYTTDELRGAAIWNPPGTFPLGWRTNTRVGVETACLLRRRLLRCAPGLMYFDRHHPTERHWYLQMLGTDPAWQGRGIGGAFLELVLSRCDQIGERVYLEASKERNIPFYARYGFVVTEEMHVPRGPVMWAMWRQPR
jgi:GNAT superfamily N-acetyltransferase